MTRTYDALVVGSGIAGLTYALRMAERGTVAVLAKGGRTETNTARAQGGIAAVMSATDSYEAHIADTIRAGAGLNDPAAVRICIEHGPARVQELIDLGAEFTRKRDLGIEEDGLDLGQEGGHTARRVVHAKDLTGAVIQDALLSAVEAHPDIICFERHMAVDLITKRKLGHAGEDRCLGAYVLDVEAGEIHTFLGRVVMLATGGAGKIYLYTSNPDVATADGIAMAWRAGATVANMEFFQFHPTCLFHRDARALLITEACRGEGGKLRRLDGTPFMENHHPMGDLAPRDVVARAIDEELKRTGEEHVVLDLTHLDSSFVLDRFPGVASSLAPLGIDITTMPIPVVPAAHYCCGGVDADMWGRTSLAGLLVSGETAHTGVHGANRLASNSLLEAMVISDLAASIADEVMAKELPAAVPVVPDWNPGLATDTDEGVLVSHAWDAIRRLMWNYVGIVRSNERLRRARRRLDLLQEEIVADYWRFRLTPDLIELRNIATAASLVVDCARMRKESRGLHYTLDYPHSDDAQWLRPTQLRTGIRG